MHSETADRGECSSVQFWVGVVVTGIGTGVGAIVLMTILRLVQHHAWAYASGPFLSGVEVAAPARRVVVVCLAGIVGALGVLALRRFTRGGPGVAESVRRYDGQLPSLRTLGNGVLSIVIVGLGASLGREAAPKDFGAVVGSSFADRVGLSPAQRRVLVACGAGAGMAAVYNVPLGGALFTVEVLLGSLAPRFVLPALATSFIATAIGWLTLGNAPSFVVPTMTTNASLVAWSLIFAPIAGVAAVAFGRASAWARALELRGLQTVAVSIAVFAALGFASLAFPQILGNGKNVVDETLAHGLDVQLLSVLVIFKFVATIACLATGAPGGLFMPTMSVGALLGGVVGRVWGSVWGVPQEGSFALVGGCALLAATTQGPISALVLVLELTYRTDGVIVPLVIAVVGATLVARALEARLATSAPGARGARNEITSIG